MPARQAQACLARATAALAKSPLMWRWANWLDETRRPSLIGIPFKVSRITLA
jgi:hypothetical protein